MKMPEMKYVEIPYVDKKYPGFFTGQHCRLL